MRSKYSVASVCGVHFKLYVQVLEGPRDGGGRTWFASHLAVVLRRSGRSSRIGAVTCKLAVLGSCDPTWEGEEGRERKGASEGASKGEHWVWEQ